MKFARVFLNPKAETWVDFGLVEGATAPALWGTIMKEGHFVGEVAVVPKKSIHHLLVLDTGETKTTLVSFPGGKPN